MPDILLSIQNLTKQFGSHEIVRDICFSVQSGEIVGIVGPNGAGKTTILSMILGVTEPSSGSIEIFASPFPQYRRQILRQVGFAASYATLPGNLTLRQNLTVFAYLYSIPYSRVRVENVMAELNLQKFANTKIALLSSGEQVRANLAKAFLNSPRLLLLDEPTASLDPSTSAMIRSYIRNYTTHNAGTLWASHNMEEVQAVCDRVMFLVHGRILLDGKPSELADRYGAASLEELFVQIVKPVSLAGIREP